MSKHAIILIALTIIMTGCSRGADDRVRVNMQEFNRAQARNTPQHTVITTRKVPRARLSGNVVIITSGEEAVYARHDSWHMISPVEAQHRVIANEHMQQRLDTMNTELEKHAHDMTEREKHQKKRQTLLDQLIAQQTEHEAELDIQNENQKVAQAQIAFKDAELRELSKQLGEQKAIQGDLNTNQAQQKATLEKQSTEIKRLLKDLEEKEVRLNRNIKHLEEQKKWIESQRPKETRTRSKGKRRESKKDSE